MLQLFEKKKPTNSEIESNKYLNIANIPGHTLTQEGSQIRVRGLEFKDLWNIWGRTKEIWESNQANPYSLSTILREEILTCESIQEYFSQIFYSLKF